MNDINKLKEQQKEKHPGFSSYLECMTRTLFTGLASFCLGFSGTYFAQRLLERKLPYSRKSHIFVSSIFASIVAYKITSDRTKACQSGWLASENKHSATDD